MKKVLKCLTLCVPVLILTTFFNISSINKNKETVNNDQQPLKEFLGQSSEIYEVYSSEIDLMKEDDVKRQILKEFFGHSSEVYEVNISEFDLIREVNGSEDVNIESTATIIPTSIAPGSYGQESYKSNWSGTKNYTYTKYKFYSGKLSVKADTLFTVEIIHNTTGSTKEYYPKLVDGQWTITINTDTTSTYYAKIINKANEEAKNAEYIAICKYGFRV